MRSTVHITLAVSPASLVPEWASLANIPHGTFADVSINTPLDSKPSDYGVTTYTGGPGPWNNWSSAVLVDDVGTYGRYIIYGSGHRPQGSPICGVSIIWNLDTNTWGYANHTIPAPTQHAHGLTTNAWGELLDYLPTVVPIAPHTYDGLVMHPIAWGGPAGGGFIHSMRDSSSTPEYTQNSGFTRDISSEYYGYTRVWDSIALPYPVTMLDVQRQGWWHTGAAQTTMKFINSSFSPTSYSGVVGMTWALGARSGCRCESQDILLFNANMSGTYAETSIGYYNCATPTTPAVRLNLAGDDVTDNKIVAGAIGNSGINWSTLLNCAVIYRGQGSYSVYKIYPPEVGSWATGTWTVVKETLTGVGGATPGTHTQITIGHWGRFIEHPLLRGFLFTDNPSKKGQLWRLTGM